MTRRNSSLLNPNPVLERGFAHPIASTDAMTLPGTVRKVALLLAVTVAVATWAWTQAATSGISGVAIIAAALVGLGLVIYSVFRPQHSRITAPAYAVAEGLVVGWISYAYNAAYDGIVLQAVALTIAITVALLGAYSSGLISPSENFKLGVVAATGGVMLLYFANIVVRLVTGSGMSLLTGNSNLAIGISAVIVVIAAANLVLDFDFIESGVARHAPKHMEWFAALGLLVTLVWLYLELLRLLAKLQSRR